MYGGPIPPVTTGVNITGSPGQMLSVFFINETLIGGITLINVYALSLLQLFASIILAK
jgi:hypothetical protein